MLASLCFLYTRSTEAFSPPPPSARSPLQNGTTNEKTNASSKTSGVSLFEFLVAKRQAIHVLFIWSALNQRLKHLDHFESTLKRYWKFDQRYFKFLDVESHQSTLRQRWGYKWKQCHKMSHACLDNVCAFANVKPWIVKELDCLHVMF